MKRLLSSIFTALLLGLTMVSQSLGVDEAYTLDVQFKSMPDSVLFTLRTDGDSVVYRQKVRTLDNKLHFSLNVTEDYPVPLYLIGKNPLDKNDSFFVTFYGGKGVKHKITSGDDGFSTENVKIEGAPWDAPRDEIDKLHADYHAICDSLRAEIRKCSELADPVKDIRVVKDVDRFNRLRNEQQKALTEYNDSINRWMMGHADAPIAMWYAKARSSKFSRQVLAEFMAKVPQNMWAMPEYKELQAIAGTTPIEIGSSLVDYDIAGEDYDGTPIRLSQFTAPYILVDFNALGCGPCRAAAKDEIPRLIEKYGDKLTFVSYSVDEDRKLMEKAHEIDKATWPTIWNGSGSGAGSDCVRWNVTGYPKFFLFGPDRKLLHVYSGWGPTGLQREFGKFIEERGGE